METPWWHGAVLYQVYVRSFRDTDGDGIGDLRGIIEKLDYLSALGVDGVWLSPTMPSPDIDWGYDVSDYFGVHPALGTLADLDDLIAAAATRKMQVLLDLVPNHTSSAHPWFVEARGGRDARYRDYYVWADPAPGGGPPNNWRNMVGDPAWTLDPKSGQYYLHNFHAEQPDLNWWNENVRATFEEILNFWFDRGVGGFRIDVAHGLYKDAELRDNPPLDPGVRVGGHGGLQAVHNANQPETHEIYRRWRKLAEQRDPARLVLGETWVLEIEALIRFYGDGDELQLAFNFPFIFSEFDPLQLAPIVATTLAKLPPGTCPVWTASNHDVSRFVTRWCGGDERKVRLALTVLLALPGTVVLYYGDELGMADVDIPVSAQRDEMTKDRRGIFNRDAARTPLRWSPAKGSGFSDGDAEPWLPLGDQPEAIVTLQENDPNSVLTLCRGLIALRRREIGTSLAYEQLHLDERLWVYAVGDIVVAANFSSDEVPHTATTGDVLLSTADHGPLDADALRPFEARITRRR